MKIARLAGLMLVVAVAMGLVSGATASAAESSSPLFLPAVGQSIVGESGPSTLKSIAGPTITCQKDHATGVVANTLLAGAVLVHYLECTVIERGAVTRCTINSKGAPEGLILTLTLHGILGLILSPAPLDTGILFLPVAGKVFVELEEAVHINEDGTSVKCTHGTKITGSVAGLITPIGVHTTKGLIVFPGGPGVSIKKIDLTHGLGLVEPELVVFTGGATLEQHDFITFGQPTGIT